jgi:hypothetical protein
MVERKKPLKEKVFKMTKNVKRKKQAYHIKHNYKRFEAVDGYKFWAKDKVDAEKYCILMNWVLKDNNE